MVCHVFGRNAQPHVRKALIGFVRWSVARRPRAASGGRGGGERHWEGGPSGLGGLCALQEGAGGGRGRASQPSALEGKAHLDTRTPFFGEGEGCYHASPSSRGVGVPRHLLPRSPHPRAGVPPLNVFSLIVVIQSRLSFL